MTDAPRGGSLRRIALVVFAASLLFSLARVPHATWTKRLRQVAELEEKGVVGYHIGRTWPKLADDVRWILANTPSNAVILWRGHWKGPIELVAAAIGDRRLYFIAGYDGTARELLGRPVATGSIGGRQGRVVLDANGEDIALGILP